MTAATWQFSAALFALQLLIWKIDKDELERWLAKTPFEDNEFNDVKTMQNKLLEAINGLNEG